MTYQEQSIKLPKHKRDAKGKFVPSVEGGWKSQRNEYQRRYYKKHPWARNHTWSRDRAKKIGREHTLLVKDFKVLWERDKAYLLKRPSIDRIDPTKGYIEGNCRFIEHSLNSRLGNLGRPAWCKGMTGVMTNGFKKGHIAWNKGKKMATQTPPPH